MQIQTLILNVPLAVAIFEDVILQLATLPKSEYTPSILNIHKKDAQFRLFNHMYLLLWISFHFNIFIMKGSIVVITQ